MTSPRFSRPSPPRKPLHERSESHTNEITSPSIRLVGEPQGNIYSSSPFPTLPSHILPPKNIGRSQGLVFEDEEAVSDEGGPMNGPGHEFLPSPDTRTIKGKDFAAVEDDYESETRFPSVEPAHSFLSSSPTLTAADHLTYSNAPDLEVAIASLAAMGKGIDGHEHVSDEIVQLPSVPGRGEALGSHRLTHDFSRVPMQQPMPTKSSETSLSSSGSTGTVIRTRPRGQPSRGSYSAFPIANRPASSRSAGSASTPPKAVASISDEDSSPTSSRSPISPALSAFLASNPLRAPSVQSTARLQAAVESGVNVQYPVLRAPTASGSWAESIPSAPTRPPRATHHDHTDRWNPHLSTVHSEDTDDRHSGTMWLPDSAGGSGRSLFPHHSMSDPDVPAPLRLAHGRRSRDLTGSTIRVVKEKDDNLTALPPIPGSRGSGLYSVISRSSVRENRRNTLQARPSSRGSFLRDSIPAWARTYYARHGSSFEISRPATSASVATEHHFIGASHPRKNPGPCDTHHDERDSLAITPVGGDGTIIAEIHGSPRRKGSQVWSPHLWHDRRCMGKRRSMYQAPSVDEQAEGPALNRRNVQILLFAFGFIFPFAWFIASFLPLPPKPISNPASKSPERRLSRLDLARDLEKALGQVDEARYENARWWRTLNRLMSILGVLVIVAIIVLAVLAVRMKN